MHNKQHRRDFKPSDDALIRQQPVLGIGLKTLATLLGTSRQAVMRRADELGVSLESGDNHDEAVDTRSRCSDKLVDPLLERLKEGTRRAEVITQIVCRRPPKVTIH